MQLQRGFKTIAAVVAGAAGDPDVLCVRRQRQGQAGCRQPSPLHEAVFWQIGLGLRLDQPRGGDVEKRVAEFVRNLECAGHA